jgi:cbb3-type cytochrome oxidase subunit 3
VSLTDIMSGAGLSWYAEIALVLFFAVFVVITWRTFMPSRKHTFDRAAELPLDDGTLTSPPRGTE